MSLTVMLPCVLCVSVILALVVSQLKKLDLPAVPNDKFANILKVVGDLTLDLVPLS